MTKYSVRAKDNGMFEPRQNKGKKISFPNFNTLRDADIFMRYMRKDWQMGIVGNVTIEKD